MKKIMILILLMFVSAPQLKAQWLKISDDGHRLVYDNGKAFIWIGDTAWELFHRCNKEDVDFYFKDRAKKGFNVIQAVVLAELDGLNTPNSYGEKPLINNDPLQPNERYFKYIDWIIGTASKYHIYLAILPAWGRYWHDEDAIFDTEAKARIYCEWLAKRYADRWNIIWVLGGDRMVENEWQRKIIRAMAEGLRKGDRKKHLITFHPYGNRSSSEDFHKEKWLDFNMIQSGHWRRHEKVYNYVAHDYMLTPIKPVIDGEPQYEDIQVRFSGDNERFTAYDVREAAYWSILSGAFGYTYGNNNVWQMWTPQRQPDLGARIPWQGAIYQPGSLQMGYVHRLFESRPFLKLIPDQQILSDYFGQDYEVIRTAMAMDGSYFIVYIPQGQTARLRMQKLKADTVSGYWYNPREGTSKKIEPFVNPKTDMDFVPVSHGPRTDWVLVLDDAAKKYPDPAKFSWR